MKLKKDGIMFTSFAQHRLKAENCKIIQIGKSVYCKMLNKLIVIKNIDNVFRNENFLYFTALGKVQVVFDCKTIYRYFNIDIKSKKFTLEDQKQLAIQDLINNNFEINFCKILKKM